MPVQVCADVATPLTRKGKLAVPVTASENVAVAVMTWPVVYVPPAGLVKTKLLTVGAVLSRVTVKPPVALQTGVLTPSAARALKVLLPGDKDTLAKL